MSGPLPGVVHDLTAARIWASSKALAVCGLVVLGDKGYLGEELIRTPYCGRNKAASRKGANRAHARLCAPGERANAQLKTWRMLRKPAAALARWAAGPRPSTFSRPPKSEDEKRSLCRYPATGRGNVIVLLRRTHTSVLVALAAAVACLGLSTPGAMAASAQPYGLYQSPNNLNYTIGTSSEYAGAIQYYGWNEGSSRPKSARCRIRLRCSLSCKPAVTPATRVTP